LAPLYTQNDHFTKTGSEQTWGKLKTEWCFLTADAAESVDQFRFRVSCLDRQHAWPPIVRLHGPDDRRPGVLAIEAAHAKPKLID